MSEQKTKPTNDSVLDFIAAIADEQKRNDSFQLLTMYEQSTGESAVMWGPSIVGFGKYHYKYDSGHEGYSCLAGFSPRKTNFSLYITGGFSKYDELLQKLGKYKKAVACIYIKKLSDINKDVLRLLILESVRHIRVKYPSKT